MYVSFLVALVIVVFFFFLPASVIGLVDAVAFFSNAPVLVTMPTNGPSHEDLTLVVFPHKPASMKHYQYNLI